MNDLYTVPQVSLEDGQALSHVSRPVITPTLVHIDMQDERIQDVITRVKSAIIDVYVDAEFSTYIGTKPLGVYIEVLTEWGDVSDILKLLGGKFDSLHVAAGVDICVLPRRRAKAQAA